MHAETALQLTQLFRGEIDRIRPQTLHRQLGGFAAAGIETGAEGSFVQLEQRGSIGVANGGHLGIDQAEGEDPAGGSQQRRCAKGAKRNA